MTSYDFDYEAPPTRLGFAEGRKRQRERGRRARGIIFLGNESGAYYYDLATRHPRGAVLKRTVDVLAATALITLLTPVLLLIMALIKLTSHGPIIFRQRRIGFRCHEFKMYKFRTMYAGAHLKEKELAAQSGGSFLKLENDPRITPIGRFLRKYSIDELPQLFNVLEGTMSLVGPRPLLISDLDLLPRRSTLRRFSTPPGITGLWQVRGRSSCSEQERLQLDREYVDRWSLALDFQILVRTVAVVVTGRGAV
ncbi:MAG TPA: sugar transferase [Thermoanaerobaculia bacterium]|nr:sugar transferase [Thermoanaerobaculia bacterium]